MQNAKTKSKAVSQADVRVLKAYINQAYLLHKYQSLKADTKEIVKGIFDRLKQNVYIIDDSSYIQKIERTQRRFDSKAFIDHVKYQWRL
jgi:Holliday junction resolvase RusA-like endonuclease